jgi:hypothetical protein
MVNAGLTEEREEWHDLMPPEKKLIGYSLGLGIVLLVLLVILLR